MESTIDDIVVEIRMLLTARTRAVLLVEGSSDARLYAKFMIESVHVVDCRGKDNAVAALQEFDAESPAKVLAIVDADYWNIDESAISSPNVLTTDGHDAEMMIVKSNSFESVLRELGSKDKIDAFLSANLEYDIRSVLLARLLPLACLRYMSHSEGLNLRFEGLELSAVAERKTLLINESALLGRVLAKTRATHMRIASLERKLREYASRLRSTDMYQLCCGHDFVDLLALALRSAIGSQNNEDTKRHRIEMILRVSFDARSFQETDLCSKVLLWQENNGVSLLKKW